jgi:hypothetical protein
MKLRLKEHSESEFYFYKKGRKMAKNNHYTSEQRTVFIFVA